MIIEGQLNNLLEGEFTLGIYTCEGADELGEFKALVVGFILFEIWIKGYDKN